MDIKKRPNYKIYLQVLRQMSPEKRFQVLNQAGIQYMITGKTLWWKWEAIYRCLTCLWSTVWEIRHKLFGRVGKEIKPWFIMETVSRRSGNSIIDTRQLTACLRRFAARSLLFCHSHSSLCHSHENGNPSLSLRGSFSDRSNLILYFVS